MCMKISKKDLIRINKGFGGSLKSDSSLDYAIDKQEEKKMGEYKKLAYLLRAILVDPPFNDANKRTATFLVFQFANQNDKEADKELLKHHVVSISKRNITKIRNIEQRLRTCIN